MNIKPQHSIPPNAQYKILFIRQTKCSSYTVYAHTCTHTDTHIYIHIYNCFDPWVIIIKITLKRICTIQIYNSIAWSFDLNAFDPSQDLVLGSTLYLKNQLDASISCCSDRLHAHLYSCMQPTM